MKKTSFLLIVASLALLLAACEKEMEKVGPEDKWAGWDAANYLTGFTMQTEDADTKATINFSSGAITWNDGDDVLVYVPATGASATYTYNGTYFEPESTPMEIGTNAAYAYYPAAAYSVSAGKVTLTMPESVTADPGNKLPMGGIIPAGGIPSGKVRREGTFKSLGSIIWVKLTAVAGKEETLSSVVMENTSLALTGKAQVNWSGETPSLDPLDGGKTIEVACSKTLSTSVPAEFFLFAPAGSMEGLSITVNFQEEAAHFKPYTKITRNSTLNLERNKVLPIAWAVNGYNTGISAKGEPIAVEGGKVLFFVDIPSAGSAIRNALGYTGDSFSGYSVYVNGTEYPVLTNKGGETYIEVDENPGGTYEAYLVKGESLGLYGDTPDKDVVMPFSQFYEGTKADFENYPRYAKYAVATGNVLSFKDAIALVNLNMVGSVKLASVKIRALGGDTAIMGYVAAFTAITEVPVMMFASRLPKRWQTVQYIRLSFIFFVIKILAYALAPSIPLFFAARILQAPSYALYTVLIVGYADSQVARKDSAKAQSLAFSMTTVGSVLASLIGGAMFDTVGVKTTMLIASAIAAAGALIALLGTRTKKPSES